MAVAPYVDDAERPERTPRWPDLAALAARQHGTAAHRQLVALGWSPRAVARLLASGRLHAVHRGVYAVGHPRLTLRGRWMAGVLAAGDGALLSHRAAAALHGIRGAVAVIDVTAPARRRSRPGLVLHESAVPADERLVEDGIPVTSVLRTLLDLASTGDRLAVERGAHAAEARRLGDRLAPQVFLERHRGEPGVAILREVLGDERLGRDLTESPLEEAFLGFLAAHGIRRPEVNAQIGDKRCDAVWRDRRLIVELDSRTWHHTLESFYADRTRDRRLEVAGWHTVRVTARDLREDPEQLAADLRELTSPGRDVR